mmetsp:Transcript_27667/g.89368  ORF Transcript_27667/g.89368 Transcript_27667/m.89368 type:complete len:203 (-) Transcript_27667:738-1346(-)
MFWACCSTVRVARSRLIVSLDVPATASSRAATAAHVRMAGERAALRKEGIDGAPSRRSRRRKEIRSPTIWEYADAAEKRYCAVACILSADVVSRVSLSSSALCPCKSEGPSVLISAVMACSSAFRTSTRGETSAARGCAIIATTRYFSISMRRWTTFPAAVRCPAADAATPCRSLGMAPAQGRAEFAHQEGIACTTSLTKPS